MAARLGAHVACGLFSKVLLCVTRELRRRINRLGCLRASFNYFSTISCSHYTQAEHESAVTSVGVSPEGLRVVVGCENGVIGTLDIPSHQYTTLLRSHTGCVNAVALNPRAPQYATAAADGTIRIWDSNSHQQVFEFTVQGQSVTAVTFHPNLNQARRWNGMAFDVACVALPAGLYDSHTCAVVNAGRFVLV